MTEPLPAVTAAREALSRWIDGARSADDPPWWEITRDLLAVVDRLTAPVAREDVDAALDALDEQYGTITMTEIRHLVGPLRTFVSTAIVAASGRRHLPTETDQWEYSAGYEGNPGTGPQWYAMDAGAFTIREAAEREVERYADAQIRLIRRRRPGPWEVCDEQ